MLTFFKRLASSVATPDANKITVFVDDAGTPSYKDETGAVHSMVGASGQGVPAGGTVGQALTKASNTDYDTQWHTLTPADIGAATAAQGAKADAASSSGAANLVWATPNGSSGTPVFRALVSADMSALLASSNTWTGVQTFSAGGAAPIQSVTTNAETLVLNRTGRTVGATANSVIRYRVTYTDSSFSDVYFGMTVDTLGVPKFGIGSAADLSLPSNQWFIASASSVIIRPVTTFASDVSLRNITFSSDNTYNVGSASSRPIQYYGVNTTISSSDARLKTELRDISEAEVAAFSAISRLPMVWKWLERAQEEGEEARMHSGPTVQAAIAIMEANNLDWTNYSAFCYDQWEETPEVVNTWEEELDEEGNVIKEAGSEVVQEYRPAGDRYSFRREELLWWCHRAMVVQYDKLEARVAALESKG